jgi:hypothetical protein
MSQTNQYIEVMKKKCRDNASKISARLPIKDGYC